MKYILSYNQNDLDFTIKKMIGSSLSVGDRLIIIRESDFDEDMEFAPWIVSTEGDQMLSDEFFSVYKENEGRIEIVITEKRIDFDHIKCWFDFIDGQGKNF